MPKVHIGLGDFIVHSVRVIDYTPIPGTNNGTRYEVAIEVHPVEKRGEEADSLIVCRHFDDAQSSMSAKEIGGKVKETLLYLLAHEIDEWLTVNGEAASPPVHLGR